MTRARITLGCALGRCRLPRDCQRLVAGDGFVRSDPGPVVLARSVRVVVAGDDELAERGAADGEHGYVESGTG
jgi:hypothetical protein